MAAKESLFKRLLKSFRIDEATRCWMWTKTKISSGYGRIYTGSIPGRIRRSLAHRIAWELFIGPIQDDLELDHLCRNPACVNPAHLEPVTRSENVLRGKRSALKNVLTHCIRGHKYAPENTYTSFRNGRPHIHCRTCARLLKGTVHHGLGGNNSAKTHCAKGHEYSPENTRKDSKGWRRCRICLREKERQGYDATKRREKYLRSRT